MEGSFHTSQANICNIIYTDSEKEEKFRHQNSISHATANFALFVGTIFSCLYKIKLPIK